MDLVCKIQLTIVTINFKFSKWKYMEYWYLTFFSCFYLNQIFPSFFFSQPLYLQSPSDHPIYSPSKFSDWQTVWHTFHFNQSWCIKLHWDQAAPPQAGVHDQSCRKDSINQATELETFPAIIVWIPRVIASY